VSDKEVDSDCVRVEDSVLDNSAEQDPVVETVTDSDRVRVNDRDTDGFKVGVEEYEVVADNELLQEGVREIDSEFDCLMLRV
jgi:hypothetical protein